MHFTTCWVSIESQKYRASYAAGQLSPAVTSQPTWPFSVKHWRGPLQVRKERSWPETHERTWVVFTASH